MLSGRRHLPLAYVDLVRTVDVCDRQPDTLVIPAGCDPFGLPLAVVLIVQEVAARNEFRSDVAVMRRK